MIEASSLFDLFKFVIKVLPGVFSEPCNLFFCLNPDLEGLILLLQHRVLQLEALILFVKHPVLLLQTQFPNSPVSGA